MLKKLLALMVAVGLMGLLTGCPTDEKKDAKKDPKADAE